jgi:O-antigen/teichoic acid export membrane protein
MGVIQKETIKGSVWSYIGAVLGFVNTGLLFPKIFATSEIGLLSIIIAIASLFSQFSSLGMNNVVGRLFPYFTSSKENKYGFFTLFILITTIGFILALIVGFTFKGWILETQNDQSGLLGEYAFYLVPMTFFILFFGAFDTYNKMLYDITSAIFLKEFVMRILNLVAILLYFFGIINFKGFVFFYFFSFFVPLLGLVVLLLIRGEISFNLNFRFISKEMKREIFLVALFGILAGFSGIVIDQVDKYLIGKYLGLSDVGIYTISFYIGTMILLPSRALNKISSTLIAEQWKENDLQSIETIYTKSSIYQYVFGMFLFLMIFINIENIFQFLPPQYADGKWVMIIICITNIIVMASGVSYGIISTASYYWYMSVLMLVQIITIIITNILLIPLLGITGAAIASLISVALIRVGSILIIGFKSSIWPFVKNHLYITLITVLIAGLFKLVPNNTNIYVDSLFRSAIAAGIFVLLMYKLKIVGEVNYYIDFVRVYIKRLLK